MKSSGRGDTYRAVYIYTHCFRQRGQISLSLIFHVARYQPLLEPLGVSHLERGRGEGEGRGGEGGGRAVTEVRTPQYTVHLILPQMSYFVNPRNQDTSTNQD